MTLINESVLQITALDNLFLGEHRPLAKINSSIVQSVVDDDEDAKLYTPCIYFHDNPYICDYSQFAN